MPKFPRRCRNQSGGAISLWVVLMTPVAAFAAVVAMAGPQRLAAESSMNETTYDLAAFAVALRDGRGDYTGELNEVFLPDCNPLPGTPPPGSVITQEAWTTQKIDLEAVCALLLGGASSDTDHAYLRRDLGNLGVNTSAWEGFYSESATETEAGCKVSENLESRNAVYVALAADWEDAGWAAAQAWPDGVRMGGEAVSRLSRTVNGSALDPCRLTPPPGSEPARFMFSE